jgi:hypothetical protein
MVNYSLGKIYKVVDNTNGSIYIGGTCEPTLAKKLSKHVVDYKRFLKGTYNYATVFKILENKDYDIVLIENYPCNKKDELHARLRHYIEILECVNLNIVGKTEAEKKAKQIETRKNYEEANKDKMKEKCKEYYQKNIDKYKAYTKAKNDKFREFIELRKQRLLLQLDE